MNTNVTSQTAQSTDLLRKQLQRGTFVDISAEACEEIVKFIDKWTETLGSMPNPQNSRNIELEAKLRSNLERLMTWSIVSTFGSDGSINFLESMVADELANLTEAPSLSKTSQALSEYATLLGKDQNTKEQDCQKVVQSVSNTLAELETLLYVMTAVESSQAQLPERLTEFAHDYFAILYLLTATDTYLHELEQDFVRGLKFTIIRHAKFFQVEGLHIDLELASNRHYFLDRAPGLEDLNSTE